LDTLKNKFMHCKGIRNNTGSRQTTGIQEELNTTCKQNASWQTTQDNETLFPNWQKESWQTPEETSRYARQERVNKWPNSMTDIMMMMMMKKFAPISELTWVGTPLPLWIYSSFLAKRIYRNSESFIVLNDWQIWVGTPDNDLFVKHAPNSEMFILFALPLHLNEFRLSRVRVVWIRRG
jgi:hypothetical protein